MVLLCVLLLLWGLPLSSATGRLRKFKLIDRKMLINDAQNACRRDYTDLVTVYDEDENNELVKILNNSMNSVSGWIGASSCKWSNGDPATFINITTITEEKCCGAVNTGGRWACINCDSTKTYFMCYDQGKESYNYSLIRENRTWFEAQLYCRENHTDLVSIRNETENDEVKKAVNGSNSWIWIGLQYNYSLYWLDGGHSAYKPNSSSKGCFTYLIKSRTVWMKMNNNNFYPLCYKSSIHVSENNMSWEEAMDYCNNQTNTTGLLNIHSENDQIETERELRRRNITGPVWVGLRQSRLFGFWIWINGLHVGNYSNWKEGSPPEHQISLHCGAIEKVDGQYKWVDKDCRKKYSVLCEII